MMQSFMRDEDVVELSIRIHALRNIKPFASMFQKTASIESDDFPISVSLENARVLAYCDLKPAQNTHVSAVIPPERGLKSPKDNVSNARWSAPSSCRTSINDGEVVWSESGGTLKWKTTRLGLRRHKSFCPKIKFQLFALLKTFPSCSNSTCKAFQDVESVITDDTGAANTVDSSTSYWARRTIKPLGWAVLDIREFENALPEKNFKINGGCSIGSEVTLSFTCLPMFAEPNGVNDTNAKGNLEEEVTPFSCDDEWTGSAIPLGHGLSVFSLTIRLENANGLQILGNDTRLSDGWLSYSIFDTVVQTDKFSFSARPCLNPVEDTFRVRCSFQELQSYIEGKRLLQIYLCTSKKVLAGCATMDLSFLTFGKSKAEVRGKYILEPINKPANGTFSWKEKPWIEASAVLEFVSRDMECSESPVTLVNDHDLDLSQKSVNTICVKGGNHEQEAPDLHFRNKEFESIHLSDVCIGLGNGHVVTQQVTSQAEMLDIEKKRLEWDSWRQRQEILWHEKLRSKEDTVMKVLEDRAKEKEKERDSAVESYRLEYSKLEGKLRKALMDVERREHQLVLHEAARQEEYSRKMTDLESKHRAVLEEAKHSVNFEKVKGTAAVERAILAEKKILSLESKLQKIEKELERFQLKMRESPEMALMEEVAQLKGQLAASESKEELERAHYKQALLEKEQYQIQLQRLAKSLKREQDRTGAHKRKEIEKLRLEFVGREELKQLDGDRLELQKIKNELRALNLVSTEADSPSVIKPQLSARQPQLSQIPNAHETWLYPTEDNSSVFRKQYSSFPIMPASKKDDLRRLTQERDDLLATGVFDEKHAVIVEIDKGIAELKAANH